jgi:hypothetical protein
LESALWPGRSRRVPKVRSGGLEYRLCISGEELPPYWFEVRGQASAECHYVVFC